MKYIDVEKLKDKIEQRLSNIKSYCLQPNHDKRFDVVSEQIAHILSIIDSLQQEQPEPYFYCKYGGTMPLCSDCKRNHNNSSFKTEEITTWYAPSNGTKHCIDYIQQEQPEVDLEKEIEMYISSKGLRDYAFLVPSIARHFYELGLNARKEDNYAHIS